MPEGHHVTDSKNLILAVVLSALVLFGWTFVTNRYFPPANPPAPRSRTASARPLPQPQAQPVPATPQALRTAIGRARLDSARRDRDAVARRARSI